MVVISIIGILVSLLLPAIASARRSAANLRELSAIQQVGKAFAIYADDNKGRVMPGYLRATWAKSEVLDAKREFWVWENDKDASDAARLRGSVIRPYPWRILPYLNFAWDAIVTDRTLLSDIRSLPNSPNTKSGYQWALAFNPSFGMNTTYVGGDAHRGAFHRPSLLRWGPFYVRGIDEPTFPDRLMTFSTARGDRPGGDSRLILPGNQRIEGPWRATTTSDTVPDFIPWTAPAGRYDPALSPKTYGHVDFRAGGRAQTVSFDGHGESMSLERCFDMTRWSNQATSSDWSP